MVAVTVRSRFPEPGSQPPLPVLWALVSTQCFFFFFTLVTGPRRSLSLKLSDTRVYEPQIRAQWGGSGDLMRESGAGVRDGADRGDHQRWMRLAHSQVPFHPPHEACAKTSVSATIFVGEFVVNAAENRSEYSWQQPTLEVTQGQILSQSPTDAASSRWHLYGS